MAIKKRFPYKAAFVACNGGCRATADCQYGCVGCELCVNVCRFEAIALNDYGVAEVNEDKCIACGKCIQSGCPSVVLSDEKHPRTGKRKARIEPVTCVGCGICTTKCKFDAIRLEKVNDTHGREYFRTLLTVAGNTPAAIGRLVRKTRGR